jgi:hypothetical protein
MRLFRKTVSTRCSGKNNKQCSNFVNKTPLPAHKLHCPDKNCGSPVIEDTEPNIPMIIVPIIVVLAGGIGYLLWSRLRTESGQGLTSTPSPALTQSPTPSPTPTSTLSPTPSPTPTPNRSTTATTTPMPSRSPTPTTTPTSDPTVSVPPEVKPPPPPTINEINTAIAKLENMNPNEILEFPVEGKENYRVIGFKKNDTYYGWNVKNVKEFLEEGLRNRGQFSKTSQIILIIINQSTKERLVLPPISKNSPLGHFVRSVNAMPG